jgi:hypothetical protein
MLLWACKKDKIDLDKLTSANWTPSFAVPLINAKIGVKQMLATPQKPEMVSVDKNTGLISLNYEGRIFRGDVNMFFQLPSQKLDFKFDNLVPIPTTFPTSGSMPPVSQSIDYDIATDANESIIKITFKRGVIRLVKNSSSIEPDAQLRLQINALSKNGVAFDEVFSINQHSPALQEVDLTSYELTLNNNKFQIDQTLTVNYLAGQSINPSDGADLTLELTNLGFSIIEGDFKQKKIVLDRDSVLMEIFKNTAGDGNFRLENPQLILKFTNGLGIPLRLSFTDLKSYNTATGTLNNINISQLQNNSFDILSAPKPSINQPIQGILKIEPIDDPSIADLIQPTPVYLIQETEVMFNPAGTTTNFITDDAFVELYTELIMPLAGYISGFSIRDTLPFSLGGTFEEVGKVALRSIITNGFPIEAHIQLYMADSNYIILDSIFKFDPLKPDLNQLIPPADIDANGKVNQSIHKKEKITDFVLEGNTASAFRKSSYIIVKADMKTTAASTQRFVKIYDDYEIGVQLGVKIDGNFNVSPNGN